MGTRVVVAAFAIGLGGISARGSDPPGSELTDWFVLHPPESGGRITVAIESTVGGIQGWSYGLCHDPRAARLVGSSLAPELAVIRRGAPPDFVASHEADPAQNDGRAGLVQAVVLAYRELAVLPMREGGFPILDVDYEILGGAASTVEVCGGLVAGAQPVDIVLTRRGESVVPGRPAIARLSPAARNAWFGLAPAVSDSALTVSVDSSDARVSAWSMGVCHDPYAATLRSLAATPELAALLSALPSAFVMLEEATKPGLSGAVQAVALTDASQPVFLPARPGGFPVLRLEYAASTETSVQVCGGLVGSGQPVDLVLTVSGQSLEPSRPAGATLVPPTPSSQLALRTEPVESSEVVTVTISTGTLRAEGWSFALCSTAEAAQIREFESSPELGALVDGEGPGFVQNEIVPADPFVAVTQRVILGTPTSPLALGPLASLPVLNVRYHVLRDDSLKFCDRDPLGLVTFDNEIVVDGVAHVPWTRTGSRLVQGALGESFIRGDADVDGAVQLTDAVYVLMSLFLGGEEPPCMDAADANDVGQVDISDPIFTLYYLFLGGPEPPPPFPEPGQDLSPHTALGCERGV